MDIDFTKYAQGLSEAYDSYRDSNKKDVGQVLEAATAPIQVEIGKEFVSRAKDFIKSRGGKSGGSDADSGSGDVAEPVEDIAAEVEEPGFTLSSAFETATSNLSANESMLRRLGAPPGSEDTLGEGLGGTSTLTRGSPGVTSTSAQESIMDADPEDLTGDVSGATETGTLAAEAGSTDTMSLLDTASAALDATPVGLVVTGLLTIGSLFADIFGHSHSSAGPTAQSSYTFGADV